MTVLTNGLKEEVTHLLPVMSLPEVDPSAPSWLMRRTEVRPGLVEGRCGAGICLSHVQAYSDLTQKTKPPPCPLHPRWAQCWTAAAKVAGTLSGR